MDIAKKVQSFFSYWYLRYLLATELYMVEPWEKVVIHILFATLFGLFWYFNRSIVLTAVSHMRPVSSFLHEEVLMGATD